MPGHHRGLVVGCLLLRYKEARLAKPAVVIPVTLHVDHGVKRERLTRDAVDDSVTANQSVDRHGRYRKDRRSDDDLAFHKCSQMRIVELAQPRRANRNGGVPG
jgi:hypothetical protein